MSQRKATASQKLRHALITEWRGAPNGPVLDLPVRSAAELALKIVSEAGIAGRLRMEDVAAAWSQAVGAYISRHTNPDSITRGVLTVRVLQPAIHHALMQEKPAILRKLIAKLGAKEVRDVRFRHG